MIKALPRDPWGRDLQGRLHEHTFDSTLLRDNPLSDPFSRPLWVYTPPGWPNAAPYPSIWLLQGYSSQLDMWRNRSAFEPTLLERVDTAIVRGLCPPVVLVMPDCWTSYGGSQFLDSKGTGRYQSYLCDELVPFVDSKFHTISQSSGRAVMGKSSGGYGALMLALQRPDLWGGVAAFAPDAYFEYAYLPDFAVAWRTLRTHQHSVENFWNLTRQKDRLSGDDHSTMNVIAMAACYSPRPAGEPDLPWDDRTGALRADVWTRWLEHDPVRLVPKRLEVLKNLRAISIECGLRDEYRLYVGAHMMHTQLNDAGVPHRFEFFEGGHGAMQHRYPATIAYLAEHLGVPRAGTPG
jgi:enterochelin esterase-like enzyme